MGGVCLSASCWVLGAKVIVLEVKEYQSDDDDQGDGDVDPDEVFKLKTACIHYLDQLTKVVRYWANNNSV